MLAEGGAVFLGALSLVGRQKGCVCYGAGNIGTVGGDALQGGEQISPDKACFDAAVPLLHCLLYTSDAADE